MHGAGNPRSSPTGPFARLGRGIVRHPWYPILFWIVLLLVTLPFLSRVSSVTENSATTLPNGAPSAVAQAELDRLFPNASGGSASYLLLAGPNITGPVGQNATIAVARAVANDPSLRYLGPVTDLYSAYGGYLNGMARIALGGIGGALAGPVALPVAVNATASLLWGVPGAYVATWSALVAANPSLPPASLNAAAFNRTAAGLGGNATALYVLTTFYAGPPTIGDGFNGTANCAADPANVSVCATATARATLGAVVDVLAPNPADRAVPTAVLAGLDLANFTNATAQHEVDVGILAGTLGLPAAWVGAVWALWPTGTATPAAVAAWTASRAENTSVAAWPLPVPGSLYRQFVDPSGTATLVIVSFTQASSYSAPGGDQPIYDDVVEINRVAPLALVASDPAGGLSLWQTGPAALDQAQSADLSASLAIVLPLTVLALVAITILYFRAPLAPLITFGGLGIALALGVGGLVLVGTLVTHVDTTTQTLEDTFVLGVGTDYSIFLVARFKEEIVRGADPKEAVVTTVTWAGQSIATSGATAVIATLALAFSGVALLSQWGMVLSLAVLLALLVSLTIIPAFLTLLGPRIFWPYTGERLRTLAANAEVRRREERTYFHRVGRRVQRHPKAVVAAVLLVSVPLLYLAFTAPISYDFYAQLPAGRPATDGLAALGQHFGPGYAFPTILLATFASPLVVGNTTNATEFADLASLGDALNSTPGVAAVQSPVGPYGAPLVDWLAFAALPPADQATLHGLMSSYVGSDGRTVLLTVQMDNSGLSGSAVTLLTTLRSTTDAFAAAHGDLTVTAWGGGAAVTNDLQQQTSLATERMAIAVSVGLVIVLLAVLRSWLIPPMAVATIGLSIAWAWAVTHLVLTLGFGIPLFFFVPTVLFILILGLGIDYNIFLLTRVREERVRGRSSSEAAVEAIATTGGIITAAAVILASAFAILLTGDFRILQAIGFSVAAAVLLDAMVVRTYLVPATLFLLGDRVWAGFRREGRPPAR